MYDKTLIMHPCKSCFKRHRANRASLAALILIASASCVANEKHPMDSAQYERSSAADLRFESLDADGNNYISYPEVERFPGLEAVFGGLDADRDGRLNAQEYGRFKDLDVYKAPADAPDLPKEGKP